MNRGGSGREGSDSKGLGPDGLGPEKDEPSRELAEWRSAYGRIQAIGSDDCPEDEGLAALAVGDIEASVRLELADHIIACRNCSERYQMLSELRAETERQAVSPAPSSWHRRLALAAAVLLIGILVSPWLLSRLEPGAREDTLRGSQTVVAVDPTPGGLLAGSPTRLSWPSDLEGEPARVRLLDATGEVVWETEVTSSHVDLSDEVRSQLQAGSSYFWVVDPLRRVGGRLGPFWFELSD